MAKSKTITKEEKERKLLELKIRKLELLKATQKYQEGNLIEYFNSDLPLIDGTYLRANPKQERLLNAWNNQFYKVFVYCGANRTGKTFIGCTIAISTVLGFWPWNNEPLNFIHKKPRKVRIIGQDWNKHIQTVVIPELHKLWPSARKVKIKKDGQGFETFWRDEKTGSTIEIMSNKQDSNLHEGWNGDLIYYDEPPKRSVRVANARGLVDRQGRELFCATLLKEAWIDKDIIKRLDDDGKPDRTIFVINSVIEDNVGYGITQEGVDQFAKTLTDEEKDARLRGIPSYMSGLVYPMYKRELHLKERFEVPLDWPVDIAIDTHPRKPHSVLFLATSPHGYKFLIHELRMHGNGKQLAEQIVRVANWGKYNINRAICDPLAKGDSNMPVTTFDNIAEVLARYDIYLETASKDKDTGILEVKKHLISDNNEPTLFIFDDLRYTISEIESYMWEKTDLQDKEKPSKECVIGSTVIDTPSGRFMIKDLVGETDKYVYSYSNSLGRITVNRANDIRLVKRDAEVWKLTLDKGVLYATPDHLVMLRNGTYKQLKDLKESESLMPLYRNVNMDGYSKIKMNDQSMRGVFDWEKENKFVYECVNGKIEDGNHVYHKDHNHHNNDPSNLIEMNPKEHMLLHSKRGASTAMCVWCGEEFQQVRRWQKHCSKKCRQDSGDSRRGCDPQRIVTCEYCGKEFNTSHGTKKYCSITCRNYKYRDNRSSRAKENNTLRLVPNNHKVISVEFYGHEDVYDMEVECDHNYCANGVFVHNCDDMMENLYRLILLNTEWAPMTDYDEYTDDRTGINETTGY